MSMSSLETPSGVLERLARIDTTSLVDAGPAGCGCCRRRSGPIRPGLRLVGRALTIDAHDDLMPMLAGLRQAGPGDVLVVTGNDRARRGR